MRAAPLPPELTDLLTKLRQPSEASRLVLFQVFIQLNKALLDPVVSLVDSVQVLQQDALTPEERTKRLTHLQQASTELLGILQTVISFSQEALGHTETPALPMPTETLQGLRTLIVDGDDVRREQLAQQLQAVGLHCTLTNTDEALHLLRLAHDEESAYQLAVISSERFDHHTAYLARTIRGNLLFQPLMLALALSTPLLSFEKERAYFSGFACVLNLTQPAARFLTKLVNSWHGWSAKLHFTRAEIPLLQKNRILLVEDDPIPQRVTQRQLQELGYTVDLAPNGHTALKRLEKNQYNLVFMDVGLPDINGLAVTEAFRKRENSAHHTPIIGLTMHALETDEENGLQAGMDDYLIKPLLHDHLQAVLRRWIPARREAF